MLSNVWVWVLGALAGVWVLARRAITALVYREGRLELEAAYTLLTLVRSRGRALVLNEEPADNRLPHVYSAICWLNTIVPFRFRVDERMLRAGHSGTDNIAVIVVPRWQYTRLLRLIEENHIKDEKTVPVYLLQPWHGEHVGELDADAHQEPPFVDPDVYAELEATVAAVANKERVKTGAILYGPPGNGKSYLVRYLACKYHLPVYCVAFEPDTSNQLIVRMFSHIKGPCIVLFEDFDSYFDNRKCLMANAKFTLDALLNVLDGTYASMRGTVAMMTANHIDRLDPALRKRPGRFQFVLELPNPTAELKQKIFDGDAYPMKATADLSLDELLAMRDRLQVETRA